MYIDANINHRNLDLSVFNKQGNVEILNYRLPELYQWEKTENDSGTEEKIW